MSGGDEDAPGPQASVDPLDALATRLGLDAEAGRLYLELARRVTGQAAARSGSQTSEFKLSALAVVLGVVLIGLGVFGEGDGAAKALEIGESLVQWVVVAYGAQRAVVKGAAVLGLAHNRPLAR